MAPWRRWAEEENLLGEHCGWKELAGGIREVLGWLAQGQLQLLKCPTGVYMWLRLVSFSGGLA
jgi:hypothetical protein